jgi:hypothetical protein
MEGHRLGRVTRPELAECYRLWAGHSDIRSGADLEKLAEARTKLHAGQSSQRQLGDGYELTGLMGERAFAEASGLPLDTSGRPAGDDGADFRFTWKGREQTIDVKTSKQASRGLLVEQGKVRADFYVLAQRIRDDAALIGWATRAEVEAMPAEDSTGHGIITHNIVATELWPMARMLRFLRALAA